jgi:hypothetical protein
MAVIIPEAIIANVIQSGINILVAELRDNSIQDQDTTLFKYFEGTSISSNQYVIFDQMKSLLLIDQSDTDKRLKVFQTYSPANTKVPSVYIHMAGESHDGAGNAIGDGAGGIEFGMGADQEFTNIFEKRYASRYLAIIISENSTEIIALYHLIRCILISSSTTTALSCLDNFKIKGSSVDLKQNIDFNLFYKTLELTFEYPIEVPDFTKNRYYLQCELEGTIING